jgi:hypothetical protein
MGLSIGFIPNSKGITRSIKLLGVVSKPIERLKGTTRADERSISLAYFESEELNSSRHIQVEDRSIDYDFNNRRSINEQAFKTYKTQSFFSAYKNVLITTYIGMNKHREEIPLYYKHKKSKSSDILRVVVHKKTNNALEDTINYGFSLIEGNVYFNYQNSYNEITNEYELYFLTISYTDGSSESCIINPVPAIEKANSVNYKTDVVYTQYKKINGYQYSLVMSDTVPGFICSTGLNSLTLFVKELKSNSIYIKKPESQRITNEWLIEINAGEVYRNISNIIYRYHIPEYRNQPFSKAAPNLFVFNKDCSVVTEKVIKLPLRKISYSEEMPVVLKMYDLDDKLVDGFDASIESVDEKAGLIVLKNNLSFGEAFSIKADFYYNTETYVLNEYNLNPYQNKDALNEKYHIYIKPNEDLRSVKVYKDSEDLSVIPNEYLYLGSVFYEEDYNIEDSFSFDLKNNQRYVSLEDTLGVNPYILQSRYGYGAKGQVLQKNNIVIVDLPSSYETSEEYTEEELYDLFKRKLKMGSNLIFNYKDDMPELTLKSSPNGVEIEYSFEGLGLYSIYRLDVNSNEEETLVESKEYGKSDADLLQSYNILYTDVNVVSGSTYSYSIKYNDIRSKRYYEIRVE